MKAVLKPCPFCNAPSQLEPMPGSPSWFRVRCGNSLCGGTNWASASPEEAVLVWNKRVPE